MKIQRLLLPALSLIVLLGFSVFAQENQRAPVDGTSCSCSDKGAGCSTSASCPSGNAVCVCSDAGCTSYCVNGGGRAGEFPDNAILMSRLLSAGNKDIDGILTKALGKQINFTPHKDNFQIAYVGQPKNHWDILEFLADNGELKINGMNVGTVKKIRDIFSAAKVNLCTKNATVEALVNEIDFFTGNRYRVVSGNEKAKVVAELKGMSIEQIINAVQKSNQVEIKEN